MADDWKPGDLALCIKMGPWRQLKGPPSGWPTDPQPGCVYVVEQVDSDEYGLGLGFAEFPLDLYVARRFKKLPPLTDEERQEALRDLNVPTREKVDG